MLKLPLKYHCSFVVYLFLEGNLLRVAAWLNFNPIDWNNVAVLLILRLYGDFAGKRERPSRFEHEGWVSDPDWLGGRISHVYVEPHFLDWKILRLLHEQFPNVFLFRLCNNRLLCQELPRVISYFDVNYTFKHSLQLLKFKNGRFSLKRWRFLPENFKCFIVLSIILNLFIFFINLMICLEYLIFNIYF